MPRGRPGAVSDRPRPVLSSNASGLGLSAIPTIAPGADAPVSYDTLLAEAGVFRDPSIETTGLAHNHPVTTRSRRGKPQTQRFPVALTATEARDLTKKTGQRHDWYCAGLQCKLCAEPLVGWVLGGRKFAAEHDHVTEFVPGLYAEMDEVEDEDEDTTEGGEPDGP